MKNGKSVRLREVELELVKGSTRSFANITKKLTQLSGLNPTQISKVAIAQKHFKLPGHARVNLTQREQQIIFG